MGFHILYFFIYFVLTKIWKPDLRLCSPPLSPLHDRKKEVWNPVAHWATIFQLPLLKCYLPNSNVMPYQLTRLLRFISLVYQTTKLLFSPTQELYNLLALGNWTWVFSCPALIPIDLDWNHSHPKYILQYNAYMKQQCIIFLSHNYNNINLALTFRWSNLM